MSVDPRTVGRRIAEARRRRGWTQLRFAIEADVSPSTVTRWESGQLPPTHRLMRLAELLEVDPTVLISDKPTLEARLVSLEERLAAVEAACPGLRADKT